MAWLIGAGLVATGAAITVAAVPKRVRYTESIEIDAPAAAIYDHIRLQARLMRWSAWPSETGSSCICEGVDGDVGARTVFLTKKGDRFGYQEVTALDPDRRVELVLHSKGPPQQPKLVFELQPLPDGRTRVLLHFHNEIARPFNLLSRAAGIVRWTRRMHLKDLTGLKAYAEPPHRTYGGEVAHELLAA